MAVVDTLAAGLGLLGRHVLVWTVLQKSVHGMRLALVF